MKRIATSIEIAAAPSVVYTVLTNFSAYPQWSPFFEQVYGEAKVGSALEFVFGGTNGKRRTSRARLVELAPMRRVAWQGGLPFGLFSGVHSFDIVERAGGSLVHDVEAFAGVLAAFMLNERRLALQRQGFIAFDGALKKRCEALTEAAA